MVCPAVLVVSDLQIHLNITINMYLSYNSQLKSLCHHSCLWCTIIALEIKLSRDGSPTILRALGNLGEQHQKFLYPWSDNKKAKNYSNLIHKAIFDILVEQVNNRKLFSKIFLL